MKITDVRVDPLRVRGTLVRVYTDEGLVGLGEAPGFPGLKGLIEDGLKPIVPKDGVVTVPNRPGLGLELDERALERLRA
jgi:L-alanine-DL-glutamate epimerase-like enolase superfamily enzyme